jgi:hypothetical protein
MKASNAVITAKRKREATGPESESAGWRIYTSEFLKGNTRSAFVDLFLADARNSVGNGMPAGVY